MDGMNEAAPVLASLNIAETVDFYTTKLGFRKAGWIDENYAIMARDQIQLHFWKCDDPAIPKHTGCYVYVNGVDGLYQEMLEAGVVHPNGPLKDHPWRMREFSILDGDGNLIRIGQRL